jgi:hypothetical protein
MGTLSLGMAAGLGVAWVATGNMPADRSADEQPPARSAVHPMWSAAPGGAVVGLRGEL